MTVKKIKRTLRRAMRRRVANKTDLEKLDELIDSCVSNLLKEWNSHCLSRM